MNGISLLISRDPRESASYLCPHQMRKQREYCSETQQESPHHAGTWILALQPLELREDRLLSFEPPIVFYGASQVKNLPANTRDVETWVQSLGQEDPLEEGMAAHPSILACRIHGASWATVHGVAQSWTQLRRRNTHACIVTCDEGVPEPLGSL